MRSVVFWCRALFSRRRVERELDREMRHHLDAEIEFYERLGIPAAEARRRAMVAFGGVDTNKEAVRDARGTRWVECAVSDVQLALRSFGRTPLFTATVTITLALGIGLNAAVIGVIDTLYLRKLPVPHPERVIGVYSSDRRSRAWNANGGGWSTVADFEHLRGSVGALGTLASYGMKDLQTGDVLGGDVTWSALVSGNYFEVLGVRPQLGRLIRSDEEQPAGAHPVVVISDHVWRTAYSADPAVVGRALPIATTSFTIIGVAPAGFTGTHPEGRTDLWIPYTMAREATGSTAEAADGAVGAVQIIGRLAAGATVAQAQANLDVAAQDLRRSYPATDSTLALHAAVRDRLTTYQLSTSGFDVFLLVWIMVALLHLVVCTNVASLMFARVMAQRREVGVRLCLGASRARILMRSLIEAALLAAIGGGGGLIIGRWLSQLLARMRSLSASDPGLDLRVVGIVAIISAATVLCFGLLPALDTARNDPLSILRGTIGDRSRGRDRSGLIIVSQVAVSLILVANAAVFVNLLATETHAAPGYDVDHLAIASVATRIPHSTRADWASAYHDAVSRAVALPGVRAVAIAQGAPLYNTHWAGELTIPERVRSSEPPRRLSLQAIGPAYFATIGAPMVRGREFTDEDRLPSSAPLDSFTVVVVNESLARLLWPDEDPLGKRLSLGSGPASTVVGVVRDAYDVSSIGFVPRAFFPLLEMRYSSFDLIVRTESDPALVLGALRSALMTIPSLRPPILRSMASIRDDGLSVSRAAGIGLSICAAAALLLTAMGLYGVVAMWAAARQKEIGIRLALGAPARSIYRILLSSVGQSVAVGVGAGITLTVAVVQIERSQTGPFLHLGGLPLLATTMIFGTAAGVAVFVPSRRATRAGPAEVLRSN